METLKQPTTEQNKTLFEVEIGGLPLKLRSSHDEALVKTLVDLVDQKIKETMTRSSNVSFQNALLLSALHIAEELLLLRKATNVQLDQIEAKTKDLLNQLENSPLSRIRLEN